MDQNARFLPTSDADTQAFAAELQRRFHTRRLDLLASRAERAGLPATQLEETVDIREAQWQVATTTASPAKAIDVRPWDSTIELTIDDSPLAVAAVFVDLADGLAGSGDRAVVISDVEDHREARVWNDILGHCQHALGLDRGSISAVVQLRSDRAEAQVDEILYELREHVIAVDRVEPMNGTQTVDAVCNRRGVTVRPLAA